MFIKKHTALLFHTFHAKLYKLEFGVFRSTNNSGISKTICVTLCGRINSAATHFILYKVYIYLLAGRFIIAQNREIVQKVV